eukprot:364344-Chlamydomonas_euryale.AAC.8
MSHCRWCGMGPDVCLPPAVASPILCLTCAQMIADFTAACMCAPFGPLRRSLPIVSLRACVHHSFLFSAQP